MARYSLRGVLSRTLAVALVLLLAAVLAVPAAWAKPSVSGIRTGDHQNMTRFVIELSEPVDFKVYTLADPYRVVVDLPEMEWPADDKGMIRPHGHIKNYRYGLFEPGRGRVVLDVGQPVAVKSAFLLPPRDGNAHHRFVLDLEGTSREGFTPRTEAEGRDGQREAASIAAPMPQPPPKQEPPVTDPRERPVNAKPVVVIDAGHGGVDPGAISLSGMYEKNITLSMARELERTLEKTGRYKVVLTRDRDIFIPLRDRVAIARSANADLFISLHADIHKNPSTRGLSVYTLSQNASDAEAAALAEKENKSDLIAGIDLSHESPEVTNILIDLLQRETMNLSAVAANHLVTESGRSVTLLQNTHRFAGFAVLKAPDVPSVLVEMGYLSNRMDEEQLRDAKYRAKLAVALSKAVDRYFAQQRKAGR